MISSILLFASSRGLLFFFTAIICLVFPTAAFSEEESKLQTPKEVVSELVEAMKINDAGRIRTVFAENASQAYGQGKPKSGKAFRSWLESDIIRVHGRVDKPTFHVEGDEVVLKGKYRNKNGYSSEANFLFAVRNGKIISWRMRY